MTFMWLTRNVLNDVTVSEWRRMPEGGTTLISLAHYLRDDCGMTRPIRDAAMFEAPKDSILAVKEIREGGVTWQFKLVEVEPVVYAIEVAQLAGGQP